MTHKILISSGGTGGHVIPAINFANFLLDNQYECILILDKRGAKFASQFMGKTYIIYSSHLSGNIFFKLKAIIKLIIGFSQTIIIFIKFRPKSIISFGGYSTFLPLLLSLFLKFFSKINIFIHEQNSVLGKVNLLFLPHIKYIFSNFNNLTNLNNKYIEKKIYSGMPEKTKDILKLYNFIDKNKINILVYGGSQGSEPVIKNFLKMIENIDYKYISNVKFIIQSPENLIRMVSLKMKKFGYDFVINNFYDEIDEILSKTNIIIGRAGAGTINDIIRFKIPSILMPIPNSINNHQYHNARFLYEIKATIIMNEINFEVERNSDILKNLINDNMVQKNMKIILNQIHLPNANQIILTNLTNDKKK